MLLKKKDTLAGMLCDVGSPRHGGKRSLSTPVVVCQIFEKDEQNITIARRVVPTLCHGSNGTILPSPLQLCSTERGNKFFWTQSVTELPECAEHHAHPGADPRMAVATGAQKPQNVRSNIPKPISLS